jgi:hypothetical protein
MGSMDEASQGRRTVYRSEHRQRARRRRRRLLTAVSLALLLALVAAAAAVVLARDGESQADPRPASQASPAPAAAPHALALGRVEVHAGGKARVAYRIDAPLGTVWTVTLLVSSREGEPLKSKLVATRAAAAKRLTCFVVLGLPPGRYRYALQASPPAAGADAGGASTSAGQTAVAGTAALRVLPPLPPAFPGRKAIAAAFAWAAERSGDVAAAVVDTNGAVSGYREHRAFQAASLAKAILLVAALRRDPTPDPSTEATLTRMVEESDNGSAYTIFSRIGAKGMREVAGLAGMADYVQGAGWVDTRVSAVDEARFFYDYESYVPKAGRSLARRLLAGIKPIQRWGIPAAAGPAGWTTYHKSGWLGLDNRLMVQAAWLEKGKKRWALAVMTDDNPERSYGWDTQKGITGLLLGEKPTSAYLAPVLEY